MKKLLTRGELAERWGGAVRTIANWENEKVIQRVDGIPLPRYTLEHIEAIEGIKDLNRFSPLERRRLENELEKTKKENETLKSILSNILAESAKVVGLNL